MNKITEFVEDFIPKNLSKKQKEKLKEELTCHILDKKDYYVDLGYGEEESIEKAIEDFCTDENDKAYINSEFENLYSERTWFAVFSAIAVAAINMVCLFSGLWVQTADVKGDPEPVTVMIGFGFIFLVLLIVAVARIKMYRKSLVAAGIINILIPASMILCVYPQNAAFAIAYNSTYLTDILTPIYITDIMSSYAHDIFAYFLYWTIPVAIALYCFISAIRIKKGKAKRIKKPKVKIAIFSCVFLIFAVTSSLIYIPAKKHIDNYPKWFGVSYNRITESPESCFNEISIGDSYSDAVTILHSKGYVSVDEYKKSLDKITLKQFNGELRTYDFYDELEIWFIPDNAEYGNGFVGVKSIDGKITGIAIGDICKNVYVEKDSLFDKSVYFGYNGANSERHYDVEAAIKHFGLLKKGDSEEIVLSQFIEKYGDVYGKYFSSENGNEKHIYRIYSENSAFEEVVWLVQLPDVRYFEFVFENGKLTNGAMYDREYVDNNDFWESASEVSVNYIRD